MLTGQLGSEAPPLVRLLAAGALADAPLRAAQLKTLAAQLDQTGAMTVPVLLRAFAVMPDESVGTTLVAALERSPTTGGVGVDELTSLLKKFPVTVQEAGKVLLDRLGASQSQQQAGLATTRLRHGQQVASQ